jgi:hypothetical protein
MDVEQGVLMINAERAAKFAFAKEVVERHARADRYA